MLWEIKLADSAAKAAPLPTVSERAPLRGLNARFGAAMQSTLDHVMLGYDAWKQPSCWAGACAMASRQASRFAASAASLAPSAIAEEPPKVQIAITAPTTCFVLIMISTSRVGECIADSWQERRRTHGL